MEEDIREGFIIILGGILMLFISWIMTFLGWIVWIAFIIGIVAVPYGFYMIFSIIYNYIVGWRRVEASEIPKEVLTALDRKAETTASHRRKLQGYKRHIRKGNVVYRVVVPRMIILEQGGAVGGVSRYYCKKV